MQCILNIYIFMLLFQLIWMNLIITINIQYFINVLETVKQIKTFKLIKGFTKSDTTFEFLKIFVREYLIEHGNIPWLVEIPPFKNS